MTPKCILTQKCAKFLYFSARTLLGKLTAAIETSQVPLLQQQWPLQDKVLATAIKLCKT